MKTATHIATLNGDSIEFDQENYDSAVSALVQRNGGGVPAIRKLSPTIEVEGSDVGEMETRDSMGPANDLDAEGVSASGEARAKRDEEVALENGFTPNDPIYSIGTRVNDLGVKNARRSQIEHAKKPYAQELCSKLVATVQSEDRNDMPAMRVGNLRMSEKAELAFKSVPFQGARLPMTSKVFKGLMNRLPCASGAAYLESCPPKLRAINFNHWAVEVAGTDAEREVVLRTRMMSGRRSAFAAVSPRYTAFDVDRIGEALSMAFPSDARGSLDYDGERVRVEGLWHTDVAPEEFVAGEIFKAGVVVRSDDTGGGSIRVQSVIWRNLCLNLIILDEAMGVDVRIRHTGDVRELAEQFKGAFDEALTSVNAFRVAWGRARDEEGRKLIEAVQGTTRESISSLPVEDVLPGIFNAIVKRDLVPVRGRAEKVVPKLLEMHRQDEAADAYGVSRASIVNAFTRYAHQVEKDPFRADTIREGAGALLTGHKGREPAPLQYMPIAL